MPCSLCESIPDLIPEPISAAQWIAVHDIHFLRVEPVIRKVVRVARQYVIPDDIIAN
jgi:hypothetical protein